jgi:hypothetical protein
MTDEKIKPVDEIDIDAHNKDWLDTLARAGVLQMTDEKIKPSAWYDLDLDIHFGEKHPEFTGEGWKPLYPESALTQAREEGRREGMREAAEKYKPMVEAAEQVITAPDDDADVKAYYKLANAIAALNKESPKEIDPNKWAFDRGLESY